MFGPFFYNLFAIAITRISQYCKKIVNHFLSFSPFLLLLFTLIPLLVFSLEKASFSSKHYEVPDEVGTRIYHDILLPCGKYGIARFTISLPERIPAEGIPCILIVGGLKTGRESLQFIPNHGNYALIGYEYPETLQNLRKINVLWHIFSVRKAALSVPYQLLHIVDYLQKQKWINNEPVNLMGYSFGSTFLPVTYVTASQKNNYLGLGIMAYGGAGIYCLFQANLPGPRWFRKIGASLSAWFFKPIDPLYYADRMKGKFLIINGVHDLQIPFSCAERLQNLVPEPKTIINLETAHMSPKNKELTLRLIQLSLSWIEENRKNL